MNCEREKPRAERATVVPPEVPGLRRSGKRSRRCRRQDSRRTRSSRSSSLGEVRPLMAPGVARAIVALCAMTATLTGSMARGVATDFLTVNPLHIGRGCLADPLPGKRNSAAEPIVVYGRYMTGPWPVCGRCADSRCRWPRRGMCPARDPAAQAQAVGQLLRFVSPRSPGFEPRRSHEKLTVLSREARRERVGRDIGQGARRGADRAGCWRSRRASRSPAATTHEDGGERQPMNRSNSR